MVYFILSVVTAPFSFSLQMANHSQQQNTTLSLALFTPSECIAWLTVFGIEAVAMVTLNALEIIIYLAWKMMGRGGHDPRRSSRVRRSARACAEG